MYMAPRISGGSWRDCKPSALLAKHFVKRPDDYGAGTTKFHFLLDSERAAASIVPS